MEQMQGPDLKRVLVLGAKKVGKTTLLARYYCGETWSEYAPTKEVETPFIDRERGLEFVDTPGFDDEWLRDDDSQAFFEEPWIKELRGRKAGISAGDMMNFNTAKVHAYVIVACKYSSNHQNTTGGGWYGLDQSDANVKGKNEPNILTEKEMLLPEVEDASIRSLHMARALILALDRADSGSNKPIFLVANEGDIRRPKPVHEENWMRAPGTVGEKDIIFQDWATEEVVETNRKGQPVYRQTGGGASETTCFGNLGNESGQRIFCRVVRATTKEGVRELLDEIGDVTKATSQQIRGKRKTRRHKGEKVVSRQCVDETCVIS